ncbi:branched-chain amino acid ABC transporter permease [Glaciimonas sp. GG7]
MLTTVIQAIISGLAVGGAYALFALSFSITFTTTKTLNFAEGDFISFGAFVGLSALWLLTGKPLNSSLADLPLVVWQQIFSAIAVILVVGAVGALLYVLAVRPFSGGSGMSWVMSTIGFGIILTSGGLALWGPSQVFVPSPLGDQVLHLFGIGIRPQEMLILGVSVLIMLVFDWVMRSTMTGKAMRAVAHDPRVAGAMGINAGAMMVGAYVVSSALAGVGGFLIAPITSASLFIGLTIGLKGFSAAIIGGLSNPRGCVVGGFALGLVESMVNLWQAQWREVVVFLLVILVLACRPYGLMGVRPVEKV